jgi:hypothetical protein
VDSIARRRLRSEVNKDLGLARVHVLAELEDVIREEYMKGVGRERDKGYSWAVIAGRPAGGGLLQQTHKAWLESKSGVGELRTPTGKMAYTRSEAADRTGLYLTTIRRYIDRDRAAREAAAQSGEEVGGPSFWEDLPVVTKGGGVKLVPHVTDLDWFRVNVKSRQKRKNILNAGDSDRL